MSLELTKSSEVSASIPQGREIAVLIGENMSMARILTKIEKDGYQVTDVLPRLRAIIVYVTPEQLKDIEHFGASWNHKVMKPRIDSFE